MLVHDTDEVPQVSFTNGFISAGFYSVNFGFQAFHLVKPSACEADDLATAFLWMRQA